MAAAWIDPVAFSLGPISVKWYGVAYIVGILWAWAWARRLLKSYDFSISPLQLEAFISWSIVGIIVGGRLGYCLLYHPLAFLANPIEILYVWEGGMAFHGGLIGVMLATYFFAKKHGVGLIQFYDLIVLCAPLGLLTGRIANFINAEHFGRPTTVSWGMYFPDGGGVLRHPSQLYEAFLEGILLFIVLNVLYVCWSLCRKVPGIIGGSFLVGYSLVRIVGEVFRQPEAHIDFLPLSITYGQCLSLIQLAAGIWWMHFCFVRGMVILTRSATLEKGSRAQATHNNTSHNPSNRT